jgi:uncharacterized OB-fold protein
MSAVVRPGVMPRLLPELRDDNRFFWTSGQDGRLRFLRCEACGYYLHPPGPVCPRCLDRALAVEPVSGRAIVHSFTVNHQRWSDDTFPPPILIGLVELAEQRGLRLTTNVVDCAIDAVVVGLPVEVCFEQYGEIFLPVFRPADVDESGDS